MILIQLTLIVNMHENVLIKDETHCTLILNT